MFSLLGGRFGVPPPTEDKESLPRRKDCRSWSELKTSGMCFLINWQPAFLCQGGILIVGGHLFANQIVLSWLCQTVHAEYLTVWFKSDQSVGFTKTILNQFFHLRFGLWKGEKYYWNDLFSFINLQPFEYGGWHVVTFFWGRPNPGGNNSM